MFEKAYFLGNSKF